MNRMTFKGDQEYWFEFFELYKTLPELWKVKSEEYKNRTLKKRAYEILLEKFREVYTDATSDTLKKKINNFRSCYRRELKKVDKYRAYDGTNDSYVPSLWYFEALDFLRDVETRNLKGGKEKDDFDTADSVDEESIASSAYSSSPKAKGERRKPERDEVVPKADRYLRRDEIEDEADILAAGWATCFRKLDRRQQLFANRTIQEILFQAALGKLNARTPRVFDFATESESEVSSVDPLSTYEDDATRSPAKKRERHSYSVGITKAEHKLEKSMNQRTKRK